VLLREQLVEEGELDFEQALVKSSVRELLDIGIEPLAYLIDMLNYEIYCLVNRQTAKWEAVLRTELEVFELDKLLSLEVLAACDKRVELFLGVSEVRKYLKELEGSHQGLLEEVFERENSRLSYGEIGEIFRRLVVEGISIRDKKVILEAVAEFLSLSEEIEERALFLAELHAYLRRALRASLLSSVCSVDGEVKALRLSAELEDILRSAQSSWGGMRKALPLSAETAEKLLSVAEDMFESLKNRGALPIVVFCAPDVRVAAQEVFWSIAGAKSVIRTASLDELPPGVPIESLGEITC